MSAVDIVKKRKARRRAWRNAALMYAASGLSSDKLVANFLTNSLVITDSVNPTNKYDGAIFSKITFTRGSTAAYYNSAGTLVYAATNSPRIDYDPVTLVIRGLLMESGRTNICLQSEVFGVTWVVSNLTVTANTLAAPDAAVTADTLTATLANGTVLQAITTTAARHVFSIWLRRKTGVGVINISADGIAWAAAAVTAAWVRYETSLVLIAGVSNPGVQIVTSGDEVYAWGAQLEAGGFITTYIPTTTVSVGRSNDVCSIATTLFNVPATGWTIFVKAIHGVATPSLDSLVRHMFNLSGGGVSAESHFATRDASVNTGRAMILNDNGTDQATSMAGITIPAAGTAFKIAGAVELNNLAASFNGAAVMTDFTANLPTVDKLYIGLGPAGNTNFWNGHIQQITVYARRLSNVELVTVAT